MTKSLSIVFLILLSLTTNDIFGQADPLYIVRVGNLTSFNIKKDSFSIQKELTGVKKIGNNQWKSISIDSFKLKITRHGKTFFECDNSGHSFEKKLTETLHSIHSKDRILIFNVHGHYITNDDIELAPLEYQIE